MNSVLRIHVGSDGRIEKVEDRWNDTLPEGAVTEVCPTESACGVVVQAPMNAHDRAFGLTVYVGPAQVERKCSLMVGDGTQDRGRGQEDASRSSGWAVSPYPRINLILLYSIIVGQL